MKPLGGEHQREQRPAVLRIELDPAAHQLGELARDRQPEAAARGLRPLEPREPLEDLLLGAGGDPGARRSRRSASPGRRRAPSLTRTVVPAGVCTSAFSTRMRPICRTRSASPSGEHRRLGRERRAGGRPSSRGPGTRPRARRRARRGRSSRRRPRAGRRRAARDRAGRWRASSAARPARASGRGTRPASPSSSDGSSSSSRKPPSEKSGVRSSCEAFAMNSPRARSRYESRSRMRSNERASWPSSSEPWSTTGSSKLPAAIRSAACSSRRIRRDEDARAARSRAGPRRRSRSRRPRRRGAARPRRPAAGRAATTGAAPPTRRSGRRPRRRSGRIVDTSPRASVCLRIASNATGSFSTSVESVSRSESATGSSRAGVRFCRS